VTRTARAHVPARRDGIAEVEDQAARAKRDLRVATEQETAEADRLEQQRRKRAEQLAQEHEKANALERYRVEAAARAEAERVEDNKRRATLGLPLLEPGESVYGNRKAQP
jgi:type I site-specific restriction endonuclease